MKPTFVPHHFSVVIGKGREARDAPGTKFLRSEIYKRLDAYKSCSRRLEKAQIVSDLLKEQQLRCPHGGAFVKHDGEQWWELSEHDARENITATFRNRLHDNYTSSSKYKSAKRRMQLKYQGDRKEDSTVSQQEVNDIIKEDDESEITPSNVFSAFVVQDYESSENVNEQLSFNQNSLELLKSYVLHPTPIKPWVRLSCEVEVNMNQEKAKKSMPTISFSGDPSWATFLLSTNKEKDPSSYSETVTSSECDDDDSLDSRGSTSSASSHSFSSSTTREWGRNFRVESFECMNKATSHQIGASEIPHWVRCLPPVLLSADSLFSQVTPTSNYFSWVFNADHQDPFPREEDLLQPVDPEIFEEEVMSNF